MPHQTQRTNEATAIPAASKHPEVITGEVVSLPDSQFPTRRPQVFYNCETDKNGIFIPKKQIPEFTEQKDFSYRKAIDITARIADISFVSMIGSILIHCPSWITATMAAATIVSNVAQYATKRWVKYRYEILEYP